MKRRYTVHTSDEHELDMVILMRDNNIPGMLYPNTDNPCFVLEIDEETLLFLKLKIPFLVTED